MPRNPDEMVQFKTRFREALRAKLEDAADQNDTSINSEIVARLEQSFRLEDDLGGPEGIKMFRALAFALTLVDHQVGDWKTDRVAFFAAERALAKVMEAMRPDYSEQFVNGLLDRQQTVLTAKAHLDDAEREAHARWPRSNDPRVSELALHVGDGELVAQLLPVAVLDDNLTPDQVEDVVKTEGLSDEDAQLLRRYHAAKRDWKAAVAAVDNAVLEQIEVEREAASRVEGYLSKWLSRSGGK